MFEIGLVTEVEIIDLNHLGQGLAKVDNFVVFISGAIIGDLVKIEISDIKKNYAIGNLISVIKPSESRRLSPCIYYDECGGCQLMHMDYKAQLEFKRNRVINELKRAKVNFNEEIVNKTMGMEDPFRYRNKTTFSVRQKNNEIHIGPYEQGTYNTVDIKSCLIQSTEADKTVNIVKSLMEKYKISAYDQESKKGTIRNLVIRKNRKNELMLIIVTRIEAFPNKDIFIKELVSLAPNILTIVQNINDINTNLIMGKKNIIFYGDGTINDTIDDLNFTVSPETFFQVNPLQTEKLYKTAMEYANIQKDDICFDIYCGIGTISLMAAKKAKEVYGVEIVDKSIINARENAKRNNIHNAKFYTGKAEEILPRLYKQNIKADVVILDPPRKGCEKEVIDTIINMSPDRLVYVSCNPSTLARDIKLLEKGGYTLEKVQPLDQFPWSFHTEAVTLLVKE